MGGAKNGRGNELLSIICPLNPPEGGLKTYCFLLPIWGTLDILLLPPLHLGNVSHTASYSSPVGEVGRGK